MDKFELLITNTLALHLQEKNYSKILEMLNKDRSVFRALVDTAASEADLLAFLEYFGPSEAGEVVEGNFEYLCENLLLPAYEKGWWAIIGWIYGVGYESLFDPLCGNCHPLVFAADRHNPAFAQAYIEGQKRFDSLSFDGERKYGNGQLRTLPEALVEADDTEVMQLCLDNGLCPNTFGFRGDRLLDLAKSDQMQALLRNHGATEATARERDLVRTVNELRYGCLKKETVDALFAQTPLQELTWFNGTTPSSKEQKARLLHDAAQACSCVILEWLYPLVRDTLDDAARKALLYAILRQGDCFPSGRMPDTQPGEMADALNTLYAAGFRYPTAPGSTAPHPILDVIDRACWAFSLMFRPSACVQLPVLSVLWKIGGMPTDPAFLQALEALAANHPGSCLQLLLAEVKRSKDDRST